MQHVPSIDQELISYISYLSTKMDIHSDVGLWPILLIITYEVGTKICNRNYYISPAGVVG